CLERRAAHADHHVAGIAREPVPSERRCGREREQQQDAEPESHVPAPAGGGAWRGAVSARVARRLRNSRSALPSSGNAGASGAEPSLSSSARLVLTGAAPRAIVTT